MSLRKYLIPKRVNNGPCITSDISSFLPDLALEVTPEKTRTLQVANQRVIECLENSSTRKRKRGQYGHYTPESRAKIAKWACDHGNTSAAKRFSKEQGRNINESTVRSIKKQYLKEIKECENGSFTSLPENSRGRPPILGKYDSEVIDYVRKLRNAGSVVNRHILIAGAKGIVEFKDRSLLSENGGHISLDRSWAESFLRRIGFVKRKGTKAARKLPFDFEEQKTEFLASVEQIREEYNIPEELVINFDQTNVSIIPCGNWTMHSIGKCEYYVYLVYFTVKSHTFISLDVFTIAMSTNSNTFRTCLIIFN